VLFLSAIAYYIWNRQSFLIYGENENKLEIYNSFTHIALMLISACMTIDINTSNISIIFQVYHTAENIHLGKPNNKLRMNNPETLATLVTQDTSLIMIDTDNIAICVY
jgi:hypothetical protein